MSGEKEIVLENGDGIQKSYKVTQVNIQRLIDDLRDNKNKMENDMVLVEQ